MDKRLLEVGPLKRTITHSIYEKLKKANELVKEFVKENYPNSYGWRYIDFVKENRFLYEILEDCFDYENQSIEEIANYAIDKICTN